MNSVSLGPVRAVFKAARLARDGLKKSKALISFVRVEPGQARAEWGRFGC